MLKGVTHGEYTIVFHLKIKLLYYAMARKFISSFFSRERDAYRLLACVRTVQPLIFLIVSSPCVTPLRLISKEINDFVRNYF